MYEESARGETKLFRALAADELTWSEIGTTSWSKTKTGKPYNNSYCMIYRLQDGKIREVKEYCDTALIDAVL